jgi:hypothetical protein
VGGVAVHNHDLEVTEESLSTDGTELSLKVHHEFTYDPPGINSGFGVMKAVLEDSFTLKKGAEGWKVTSFIPVKKETVRLKEF